MEDPGAELVRLHFSEQYLTWSQFIAHALRHTISRPQR